MTQRVLYALILSNLLWYFQGSVVACQLQIKEGEGLALRSLATCGVGSLACAVQSCLSRTCEEDDASYLYPLEKSAKFLKRASVFPGFIGAVSCLCLAFKDKVPQAKKNNLIGLGLSGLTLSVAMLADDVNGQMKARQEDFKQVKILKCLKNVFWNYPYAYFGGGALVWNLGYLGVLYSKIAPEVKKFPAIKHLFY
jgi:hypothetical protein